MSKHTKGPWHVAGGVQIRSERDQIAKVWMMRHGEGQANAHLISAAPDLLEALESLACAMACYDKTPEEYNALASARAAIAKAKGEQA